MKKMLPIIGLALVMASPQLGSAIQDNPTDSAWAMDATSLTECALLNAAAVTSADVFVTEESQLDNVDADSTKGVLFHEKRQIRVIFDEDIQGFAYYSIDARTAFNLSDASDQENRMTHGFCWRGGQADVFFRIGGQFQKMRRSNFPKGDAAFLARVPFPDPRGLMLGGRLGVNASLFQDSKQALANLSKLQQSATVKKRNDRMIISLRNPQGVDSQYGTLMENTYDLKTLTLIATKDSLIDNQSGKALLFQWSDITWREVDGIFLPRKVVKNINTAISVNGSQEVGTKKVIYTLHWLAVNRPVDPSHFDGSRQDSPKRFRQAIEEAVGLTENRKSPEEHR